jgi:hypothetical protein
MKTIYNNVILGLFILLMFSCYKDESNIVITKPNQVNINEFNEKEYKLIAFKDTLKIAPVITSKHNDLEYFWGYYKKTSSSDGSKTLLDTISHEKNLKYPVDIATGVYKLVFCVKDIKTGISVFSYADFSVETKTSRGWFILKDKDGFSDLDMFNETGKMTKLISKANNGRNLKGKGLRIGFTSRYSYLNPKTLKIESEIRCMVPMTESDVSMIRVSSMKELNNHEGLFFATPGACKPTFWATAYNNLFYANNGKAYFIFGGYKHSGKFGAEQRTDHESSLSKYVLHGRLGVEKPMVFDEVESSFYMMAYGGTKLIPYENRYSPFVRLPKSYPNKNLNSDLLYMGYKKGGVGRYLLGMGIALLKKRSTPDTLLLVHLNMNTNFNMLMWAYKTNPVFKMDTVPSNSELSTADLYALNKDFGLLYYTKDNKISYYNIETKQEEVIYSLPAGEKITYINHSKYDLGDDDEKYHFDKLVIASHSGGKYKVYLFDMLAGKPKGDPVIMEGEGRVADVIYISPHLKRYNY